MSGDDVPIPTADALEAKFAARQADEVLAAKHAIQHALENAKKFPVVVSSHVLGNDGVRIAITAWLTTHGYSVTSVKESMSDYAYHINKRQ